MTATSTSTQAVVDTIHSERPEWPVAADRDTVDGDPWPLAWDAATFIEAWFDHPDHNDLEEALCHLPIDADDYGYDTATWHSQHPPDALLRSHLLRIVKGWNGEKALHDYLDDEPGLVAALGLHNGLPAQATLWRVWNKGRLSNAHKEVLTTTGQILVDVAREHDVPAPDEVFQPDPGFDVPDDVEQDDATVRDRTIANTKEVWQHAKPMVTKNYSLNRADNNEVHENAFWEAHAYMGSRTEMCAEDGTWNFAAETTRERVQTGSTHRHHLQKIGPAKARRMHQDTTRELVERARQDSELVDGVMTSIDITKSNPYRTNRKLERDGNGNVTNTWLLGYKEDEDETADFYFQWASIQIVGLDIPLVLDAVPVYRGMSRADIVDSLLDSATDLVDVDLVMMDREFDGDPVKDACEKHGVSYLNSGRMHSSERAQCTRLRQQGKDVHIETDGNGSTERKLIYFPAQNPESTSDEPDNDEADDADDEEDDEEVGLREELIRDFADTTDEDVEDVGSMFGEVIEEVQKEEAEIELPGGDEDTQLYMLFETNHPDIEVPDAGSNDEPSELEKLHMAGRLIRKYRHRWGIENGYKQIKSFRVRTTSMNYEYRFFNFLYACTMYNVWRLVDLLVKLELLAESEFRYKPLVTADLFLTIAKEHNILGLDAPPP